MKGIHVIPGLFLAYGLGGILYFIVWTISLVVGLVSPHRAHQRGREVFVRAIIHTLAKGWASALAYLGILRVNSEIFLPISRKQGLVLAANHPTYLDAILLLGIFPDLFCLTKGGNLRDFRIANPARQAGYVDNQLVFPMVRQCVKRLLRGENLLIFPEGTRTTGRETGKLRRGFAVIAMQARSPIRLIRITSRNGSFMGKGHPFFSLCPRIPLEYLFEDLGEIHAHPGESSRDLTRRAERLLRVCA